MRGNEGLRVGVVGCGYWGARHVRVFSSLPGVAVTAIDRDVERARSAAWPYRSAWAGDLEDSLDELDAVVVATPPAHHHPLAAAALDAGRHVLVEKPLTTNIADGEDLVRRAQQGGLTLMVGHTFLANDAVRALRSAVTSDAFGPIRHLDSARLNLGIHQEDVDVLWDLAPHDISIFNHLVGGRPLEVGAWAAHGSGELADAAYLRLVYPGGVIGTIHVSWTHPTKVRTTTVVGERMMAVYDDTAEQRIALHDRRVDLDGPHRRYHHGGTELPAIDFREPLVVQAEEFVEAIRSGEPPHVDGEAGLDVVRVLCAADLALARGTSVTVDEALVPTDVSSLVEPSGPLPALVASLRRTGYEIVEIEPESRVVLRGPDGDQLRVDLDDEGCRVVEVPIDAVPERR